MAISLFALPASLHCTAVAAVRTQKAIVIGGDSKLITGDGRESGIACKTKVTNNVVYGYSGFLFVPSRQFAASDIIRPILDQKGSLAKRAAILENEITPRIIELLTEIRRGDPSGYEKTANTVVFAIVLATIEDHIPRMMSFSYKPTTAVVSNDPIILTPTKFNCPGDCPSGEAYIALGSHDTSVVDEERYRSIWKQLGLEGAIRHLIEDEVLGNPLQVAPLSRLFDCPTAELNGCRIPSPARRIGKASATKNRRTANPKNNL